MFIYGLRFFMGALVAALGGVDAISFSGCFGEYDVEVRARACEGFAFLGLIIDAE
jgi:acetate kinase